QNPGKVMQNQTPKSTTPGTLYGIGVGPGDPELIPLKAVNILHEVDVVFSASSSKNQHSLALKIARPHLPETARILLLPFPMTMDRQKASQAWQEHTETILQELSQGHSAAFITLGDPLTYSTYGYLLRSIQETAPQTRIETIPGITSYQAAAAATNTPLVEGEENLLLLSGVQGGSGLKQLTDQVDNVVFLKAYKNITDICDTLRDSGRLSSSVGVVRCGFQDQEVFQNVQELCRQEPRYWTLIISKPGRDNGSS
ncbi:MAG: precorrin-2 C(20)-methyltransferase, partial [Desulfohalobiaceae bacterium]